MVFIMGVYGYIVIKHVNLEGTGRHPQLYTIRGVRGPPAHFSELLQPGIHLYFFNILTLWKWPTQESVKNKISKGFKDI